MAKKVGVCLTTIARRIGVKRSDLINKLLAEFVLDRNEDAQLIPHANYRKSGFFFIELEHPQGKTYKTPVEVIKATGSGMEFLRDFCAIHNIQKADKDQPKPTGPTQLSVEGQAARRRCLEMANS